VSFNYFDERHENLPHVVKFSGGRTSGYLLFRLLRENVLKNERGDVVVFNNTSCEHPATYDFVRECKKRCESEFGIPFFITEYQTYEDATKNGVYARFASFRICNDQPFSEQNQNGYKQNGEVFEELMSYAGGVPNLDNRTCTIGMKMNVTKAFMRSWLSGAKKIERLGHFGERSLVDGEVLFEMHKNKGGSVPKEIFLAKKEFLLSQKLVRDEAKFADFTNVPIAKRMANLLNFQNGGEYVTFIGFRADEIRRINKMQARVLKSCKNAELRNLLNSLDFSCHAYLPDGLEHCYMPLIEWKICASDVFEFWENEPFDLELDKSGNYGNCVFCFMKGIKKLVSLGKDCGETLPCKVAWWAKMERKYSRDLVAENRERKSKLVERAGFFREDLVYEKILNGTINEEEFGEHLPCNCTD